MPSSPTSSSPSSLRDAAPALALAAAAATRAPGTTAGSPPKVAIVASIWAWNATPSGVCLFSGLLKHSMAIRCFSSFCASSPRTLRRESDSATTRIDLSQAARDAASALSSARRRFRALRPIAGRSIRAGSRTGRARGSSALAAAAPSIVSPSSSSSVSSESSSLRKTSRNERSMSGLAAAPLYLSSVRSSCQHGSQFWGTMRDRRTGTALPLFLRLVSFTASACSAAYIAAAEYSDRAELRMPSSFIFPVAVVDATW
ncbi:hypothetical protein I4F81_002283 [Pyropia yezoensis]|uniref:Uncharacterized protein n=1 Tax=Pyropia yezoensis TaxID=2788 RepID=A0ACC3BPN6_PYRYE|nr:hypothetical protein I4F81_002283 [Neopyropia yezoensis]